MSKNLGIEPPKAGTGRAPRPPKKSRNTKLPEAGSLVPMNFKVPTEFKQEFKIWAATHQMTQRQALEDAFELLKQQYK